MDCVLVNDGWINMKCTYEYDQDPRYGWASIDLEGKETGMIVIHASNGSFGFEFSDGVMTPVCICNVWDEGECACPNVDWD